jgi:amidase
LNALSAGIIFAAGVKRHYLGYPMQTETEHCQPLNADVAGSLPSSQRATPWRDDVRAFVPGKLMEWQATGSGVLDGLSCGVKDVFDIAGCSTGYGNPDWETTHDLPDKDAAVVSALRRHGARLVGKTITDELAFSLAGNNYHYGSPVNSAATDRLTGGSSCGSAAAVAAGLCDIGLGTDTAGSVRAPASFCGIYGFRSTHGVIAKDGICRLAHSFDTVGWLTRDACTLAAVGEALLPHASRSAEVKGWISFDTAWESLSDATPASAGLLTHVMEPLLGERSHFSLDMTELDEYVAVFRTMQFYQVWNELGPWIEKVQPVLGPDVRERIRAASTITKDEYLAASKRREAMKSRFDSLLEGERILVMPTVSEPAPMRAASVTELNRQRQADLRFLCIASLAGLPQISLPAFDIDAAPVGLSLIGAAGTDIALLQLGARLEARLEAQREHRQRI